MLRIVDHDAEKNDNATDDAGDDGIGKLVQSGLLVQNVW